MRLYVSSKSNKSIGYTPDWLAVTFQDGQDEFEIIFDIIGDINYDIDSLNCRVKGDLNPWVLRDGDGNEEDLYELCAQDLSERYPVEKIYDIIKTGTHHRIGVYPAEDTAEVFKEAEDDVLSECIGLLEWMDYPSIEFSFETELNIY